MLFVNFCVVTFEMNMLKEKIRIIIAISLCVVYCTSVVASTSAFLMKVGGSYSFTINAKNTTSTIKVAVTPCCPIAGSERLASMQNQKPAVSIKNVYSSFDEVIQTTNQLLRVQYVQSERLVCSLLILTKRTEIIYPFHDFL